MEIYRLINEGFRAESIRSLMSIKANEGIKERLEQFSLELERIKRNRETSDIPCFGCSIFTGKNLSEEEQIVSLDRFLNPTYKGEYVEAELSEFIEKESRFQILKGLGFIFAPISPYPLVEPHFKRVMKDKRSILYKSAPNDNTLFLVRELEENGSYCNVSEYMVFAPDEESFRNSLC